MKDSRAPAPTSAARRRLARRPDFGLIIPDLGTTEIFEPICQGIANAPGAAGHALLWPHSNGAGAGREQQTLELCEQCITRHVSGVFFAPLEMTPCATEVNRQIVAVPNKAGIPTVFLDRRLSAVAQLTRPRVSGSVWRTSRPSRKSALCDAYVCSNDRIAGHPATRI